MNSLTPYAAFFMRLAVGGVFLLPFLVVVAIAMLRLARHTEVGSR